MDKKSKILIADDSAFMRKVLKDILSEDGFENFSEAENGEEVISKFKTEKPDLVLLDMIMPKVDGMEVLKQIGDKVTVIVISAIGQEKMIGQAKEAGASDYITKPFEKENVLKKISSIA